jgi:hypothetical protein
MNSGSNIDNYPSAEPGHVHPNEGHTATEICDSSPTRSARVLSWLAACSSFRNLPSAFSRPSELSRRTSEWGGTCLELAITAQ